jgi:DNA repair exonuclease SbcCD ATPase subunit
MTKKKVVTSRLIGIPAGSKALQSPKALLRAAEARVRDLTQQLALKQTYFDQDAYVRQLQGELQTLEQKHEDLVIRGTEREKELEYEVRKLQSQHDTLIAALSVVGRVATRAEGL